MSAQMVAETAKRMPKGDSNRKDTLQQFYQACDRVDVGEDLVSHNGRRTYDDRDKAKLAGLVMMLSRVYGCLDEERLEENGRIFVSDWEQRGFSPRQVIKGIRRAPELCIIAPTCGVLQALIRGESFVAEDPTHLPEEPAQLAEDNPYEQLAQKWERENARGKYDGKQRTQEFLATLDGHPIANITDAYHDWQQDAAGEREEEAA